MVLNREFEDIISKAIQGIESKTSAEVVISWVNGAEEYKDKAYLIGLIGLFLGICIQGITVYCTGRTISFISVLLNAAISFALFCFIASKSLWLKARLTSSKRKQKSCIHISHMVFHKWNLHKTRDRNSILIMLFPYEERIIWLSDIGIEREIPQAEINKSLFGIETLINKKGFTEEFIKRLECLGCLLSTAFPSREDNPDELPNTIRIED